MLRESRDRRCQIHSVRPRPCTRVVARGRASGPWHARGQCRALARNPRLRAIVHDDLIAFSGRLEPRLSATCDGRGARNPARVLLS